MKKTVLYIRVSDDSQNTARQEAELRAWAEKTGATGPVESITEKVSGAVKAADRKLARVMADPEVGRVVVQDIDRLGRDTIDILATVRALSARGVNLTVTSLGMDTLLPDGRENDAFKIVLSVMASLAEIERAKMRERQRQGVEAAKARGAYRGRLRGTEIPDAEILKKYPKVAKELRAGTSVRKTAKLCGVSPGTVQKVAGIMKKS